jgi:hypothetical protein
LRKMRIDSMGLHGLGGKSENDPDLLEDLKREGGEIHDSRLRAAWEEIDRRQSMVGNEKAAIQDEWNRMKK